MQSLFTYPTDDEWNWFPNCFKYTIIVKVINFQATRQWKRIPKFGKRNKDSDTGSHCCHYDDSDDDAYDGDYDDDDNYKDYHHIDNSVIRNSKNVASREANP